MIMIAMMKIMLKIKLIKNIKKYLENRVFVFIKNKKLTREKMQTTILIYYIQNMKRLPCLICSVKVTFIKTKKGIFL